MTIFVAGDLDFSGVRRWPRPPPKFSVYPRRPISRRRLRLGWPTLAVTDSLCQPAR
ncbi:hypothetical protein ACRAWD_04480 [Caulobacter segnis]